MRCRSRNDFYGFLPPGGFRCSSRLGLCGWLVLVAFATLTMQGSTLCNRVYVSEGNRTPPSGDYEKIFLEARRAIDDFDYDGRTETEFREHDNGAYYNIPGIGDNTLFAVRDDMPFPSASPQIPRADPGAYFDSKKRGRGRDVSASSNRSRARPRRR